MAFNTTRLLSQINLIGSLQEGRFIDQEILDVAYDCLLSEIVPVIISEREEYFVTYKDITITANQSAYSIPERALNGVLREVKVIDGDRIKNLKRVDIQDLKTTATGCPNSFYVAGNNICLYPTPSTTENTLRLYYFIRPSKLVSVIECGQITGISGNVITLTIPSTWTDSDRFDLIRGRAHYDILSTDLSASSVSGSTIEFQDDVPSNLTVGDYVTLAGETCFPYLPPEGHSVLIHATVTALLESMGDPAAAISAQKTKYLMEKFKNVLSLRIQGEDSLGKRLF